MNIRTKKMKKIYVTRSSGTARMNVGFQVLKAAGMKMAVLWRVLLCSGRNWPTIQTSLLPPPSGLSLWY
jgi:hypothetical protein